MGIWRWNFRLKELKLEWWLKKAETDWDKGRKDGRNENKTVLSEFEKVILFKGKNIATISLCLIPLPSVFMDETYWRTILK